MPPVYDISGLAIDSSVELASLPSRTPQRPSSAPNVTFRLEGEGPMADPPGWHLVRTFRGEERPWLSVARTNGPAAAQSESPGYLLRIHDAADFWIDAAGSFVTCAPLPATPTSVIEQLFVDQVLPQLLHLRGRTSLHASAVLWGDMIVAFLAPSGGGKSTLAAGLASLRNLAVVSDDCLAIAIEPEGVRALPSYPAVRLCQDAARALFPGADLPRVSETSYKRRVGFGPSGSAGALWVRAYVLEEAQGPSRLQAMTRRDAAGALVASLHRLDPDDRSLLAAELSTVETIAERVPFARLAYRRDFERLASVADLLEEDLKALGLLRPHSPR